MKLQMQMGFNDEWIDIWETEETELEDAWDEIDEDVRPTEGGWIRFEDDEEEREYCVNGGFNEVDTYDVTIEEGMIYSDPEGEWEVLEVYETTSKIVNVQEGNSNFGDIHVIENAEIEYFMNNKEWN